MLDEEENMKVCLGEDDDFGQSKWIVHFDLNVTRFR